MAGDRNHSSSNSEGLVGSGIDVARMVDNLVRHTLSEAREGAAPPSEAVRKATKLALRILSSSIGTSSGPRTDEAQTCAGIKRRLLSANRNEDGEIGKGTDSALRFQDLVRRLQVTGTVTSRLSVLRFLECLAQPSATKGRNSANQQWTAPPALIFTPPPGAVDPIPGGPPPLDDVHGGLRRNNNNTRAIEGPALSMQAPPESSGGPLSECTERALLRDALYALQGIDGIHVRYDSEAQVFAVDPSLSLSPATRDLVRKICEMGWLFDQVNRYATSTTQGTSNAVGLVRMAFAYSIQEELTDYYRLIAVMEAQLGDGSAQAGGGGLTLRRLALWSLDPMERLRLMATLADSAGRLQGGALASCLHTHTAHGDPAVRGVVLRVMKRVCAPMFAMVRAWICEGQLNKIGGGDEFFIIDREVQADGLWADRYRVNYKVLPQFISKDLASKILVAGKAINFMRQCGGDATENVGWSAEDAATASASAANLQYGRDAELESVVFRCAAATNARALHLVMVQHALPSHLRALKKFLLLGQGDFVTALLDALGVELGMRASTVYHHNLSGIVDGALRGGATQYEAPEFLDRVAVKMLDAGPGDTGWDVFSLCYTVQAPLSSVIHAQAALRYRLMFHLLWRIKRAEWLLAAAWRQHMSALHSGVGARDSPLPLRTVLHRCSLIRAQMVHFVTNLSNYMMFEVLETSWLALQARLEAAKDLDSVIAAHDDYLTTILDKALMGDTPAARAIMTQLTRALDTIVAYCGHQEVLLIKALAEVAAAREEASAVIKRTEAGQWGRAMGQSQAEPKGGGIDANTLTRIEETAANYTDSFGELLLMLESESEKSEILRYLTFRLDFNSYYHMNYTSKTEARSRPPQQPTQQKPQQRPPVPTAPSSSRQDPGLGSWRKGL